MAILAPSFQRALLKQGVRISSKLLSIEYNASIIPGSEGDNLGLGANCQVFAYAILKANGRIVKNHRSSELWRDESYPNIFNSFAPLDLMLYSASGKAYGAHVGVYLINGKLVHLSREVGRPEIISHYEMLQNPKYQVFIGAKRVQK